MKKRIIGIVSGLFVIAILIAGIIFIKNNFDEKPETKTTVDNNVTPSYKREGITIYEISDLIYSGITVKNEHGEYTVRKNDKGNIYIEGLENVPLLEETSKNMYESALSIKSESTIKLNADNLSDYGLDEPEAYMYVNKNKGNADVFAVGDKTPDGGGYYFRNTEDNNVYAVSTYFAERLLKDKQDFIVKTISDNFDTQYLEKFNIDRTDGDDISARLCTQEELDSNKFESIMLLEKPFYVGAHVDNVRACAGKLSGLEATKIVSTAVNDEELKNYGLDNPVIVSLSVEIDVSLMYINEKVNPYYDSSAASETMITVTDRYKVGSKNDRDIYVMYNDIPVIYAVDIDTFSFLEQPLDYFCQRLVSIKYLKDLQSVTIETEDESYNIKVWTETDGTKLEYKASYQNMPLKGLYMQRLYKLIVGVTHYGLAQEPQGVEPMLSITLKDLSGKDMVIEFIPTSEDRLYAFCKIDGEGKFKVLTSQLDRIVKNTRLLVSGEEVEDAYA